MIKRIVFVSIFKEGEGGGEGRVAYELARAFAKTTNVVMLCPGEETRLVTDETGFRRFTIKSATQGNVSMPLLSPLNNQAVFRFLDAFQPQVIHVHDPALLGVMAQMWAKENRVPLFYTAHVLPGRALDFGVAEISRLFSAPINEALTERYLLNFYQNCDCVVALNQRAVDDITRFGYGGSLAIIPNGRNLKQFHACAFADSRAETKKLTFIGFLNKRKNQAYLLEMMRYLPQNYQLTLIGEPLQPEYRVQLEETARATNVNVRFAGKLKQSEIAAELAQTHVFVSASRMEVQSLVIIEALASGTPVVGLSNETVDELVDECDGAWLATETAPEDFAAAVRRVAELPPGDYESLCRAARERVNALDWSNVMEKTIVAYEAALRERELVPQRISAAELLEKYLTQLPAGRLRERILETAGGIELPRPRGSGRVRVISLAGLNMAASMVAYPLLKGPLARLTSRPRRSRPAA